LRQAFHGAAVGKPEQCSGVTSAQNTCRNATLHQWGKPEQPQGVGDLRTRAAYPGSQLVLGAAEVVQQLLVSRSLFKCVELTAVQVLKEGVTKQVVVAGYETHVCVCQTALDAKDAGYQVHLVRDASGSRTEGDYGVGLDKMAAAGVLPASTETVIFELLEKAGTDEFRALLPVIKRK